MLWGRWGGICEGWEAARKEGRVVSGRGTAMAKAWHRKGGLPAGSQDQISVAVPSYEAGRCQHMDKHPFEVRRFRGE